MRFLNYILVANLRFGFVLANEPCDFLGKTLIILVIFYISRIIQFIEGVLVMTAKYSKFEVKIPN